MYKQPLPNATLIIVFGILSILGCCCYGILGLIFGIIALILSKKAMALYKENPEIYDGYDNVKIGQILAIIGVIISGLYFIFNIALMVFVGFSEYQDIINDVLNEY